MATRFQEASVAVHDIIQKSQLISSPAEGPPARYRLLTVRSNLENDGSVRKWTLGQRDINMQNKTVLMVGETGSGKTTVINAMVNYVLGVKFTDEVLFEITEEGGDKQISDQSESQTSEITVYEIFVQDNPMCLTIIDTPGYGDTRGTDKDNQVAENLYKLFRSDTGVKEIDAVCLVVKATENRLSDRQQYIFDAVLSLFGKDIENNIVIFVTHSNGMPPTNALNAIKKAAIPCRKDEENEPEHFLFNNSQKEKRRPKYNRLLQSAWDLTEDSLNHFFASLKEENRKSLEQTNSVLIESKQLEACIVNLQNRINFVKCKAEELTQTQKALEQNRENIKKNENFNFTVKMSYKKKVLIEKTEKHRKVTSCSVCEENCHEFGCSRALTPWWCYVMKKSHCTVCTDKCHYSKHVRENKKYVTLREEVTKTYDDLKKQYESSKKDEEENMSVVKGLKEELIKTEKEKADLVEEGYNAITKLSQIALKPDSAFIVQALNFLIPLAEETGKHVFTEKLRELGKIQPESQERVNAVKGYFDKIKSFLPGNK